MGLSQIISECETDHLVIKRQGRPAINYNLWFVCLTWLEVIKYLLIIQLLILVGESPTSETDVVLGEDNGFWMASKPILGVLDTSALRC